MQKFNPHASHPAQAWEILVGKAMNRQTVTYLSLSRLMYGRYAAGVMNAILGHIAFFCVDNRLPALASIVVGKDRGTPGAQIPINSAAIDQEREKVYQYDWYDVYPPSEEELSAAASAHSAN